MLIGSDVFTAIYHDCFYDFKYQIPDNTGTLNFPYHTFTSTVDYLLLS